MDFAMIRDGGKELQAFNDGQRTIIKRMRRRIGETAELLAPDANGRRSPSRRDLEDLGKRGFVERTGTGKSKRGVYALTAKGLRVAAMLEVQAVDRSNEPRKGRAGRDLRNGKAPP